MPDYTIFSYRFFIPFIFMLILSCLSFQVASIFPLTLVFLAFFAMMCFSAYKFIKEGMMAYSILPDRIEISNRLTGIRKIVLNRDIGRMVCSSGWYGGGYKGFLFFKIDVTSKGGKAFLEFESEADMAGFIRKLPESVKGKISIRSRKELEMDEMKSLPERAAG
jgi:predicted membrane protein